MPTDVKRCQDVNRVNPTLKNEEVEKMTAASEKSTTPLVKLGMD